MKFKELFEMPEYIDKELPKPKHLMHAISVDSLDREYDLLDRHQDGDVQVVSAIKKDLSSALIGNVITRDDGKKAIKVVVTIDFHTDQLPRGMSHGTALQVDTVLAVGSMGGFGYGYTLYKDILRAGHTVISDNVQYIGGKQLWMKIVRRSALDGHYVFIWQDGKPLTDDEGNVVRYDGTNIPDNKIWGKPGSLQHHHTLLVARENK